MKIPRFMREYAAYTKKALLNSALMEETIKEKLSEKVDQALQLVTRGMITVDEGMKMINGLEGGLDNE